MTDATGAGMSRARPASPPTPMHGPPDRDRLRLVAERLVRHPYQAWFYGDSIGFEGLLAASELLGDPGYAAFARGFLRGWAAHDVPYRPDDNTAPGHALCAIVEETGDVELRAAAERLGTYLAARRRVAGVAVTFEDARRSMRAPYGAIALGPDDEAILADPGAGIYVDCLHFDPPFDAHLGRLTGDDSWSGRALTEAEGYARLLRDPATGLYHHFWLERTGRAYALGWGRGQGWALLGLLDLIDLIPAGDVTRERLAAEAGSLAEAMRAHQRDDGHWYAVVHEPASGDETSTAAFMATAFFRGLSSGLLEPSRFAAAAERAWAATWSLVDDTGLLTGVSAAVYSSTEPRHYHHVPRGFDVPWGQGPVLTAALARRRWTEGQATGSRNP